MALNNNFTIKEINDKTYKYLILPKNSCRPDDYMEQLVSEINALKYNGHILLDLLLANGLNVKQRYYSIIFNNGKICKVDSFIPSKELMEHSSMFYANNMTIIEKSILTKYEKDMLKKDLIKWKNNG